MEPVIVEKSQIIVAGISGDGNKTYDLWKRFSEKDGRIPHSNKVNDDGYEIRMYHENGKCDCFVGVAVANAKVTDDYELYNIPAGKYVIFDIYPSKGWDSSNEEMNAWLKENANKYTQIRDEKTGAYFVIEYYGARFKGIDNPDSVVEMWIPLKAKAGE
ncbi:MAG: GyrI-like domain-containing protein [Firmicutes bacterium]|nr:GyrI-like domain-containing protein [Bacillota bacterium]